MLKKANLYHATNKHCVDDILSFGFCNDKLRRRPNEWLGHGHYFFAYPSNAKIWIIRDKKLTGNAGVLKCEVAFEDSWFLDMDDPDVFDKLLAYLRELIELMAKEGIGIKKPKDTKSDGTTKTRREYQDDLQSCYMCFALNAYRDEHLIKLSKYTFKHKRGPSGYIVDNDRYMFSEIQYCVYEPNIINSIVLI